jgi:hypothetical protein
MSEPSVPAFALDDITGGLEANASFSSRPLNINGTVITVTGQSVVINSAAPLVVNADLAVNGNITASGNILAGGINSNHHSH